MSEIEWTPSKLRTRRLSFCFPFRRPAPALCYRREHGLAVVDGNLRGEREPTWKDEHVTRSSNTATFSEDSEGMHWHRRPPPSHVMLEPV